MRRRLLLLSALLLVLSGCGSADSLSGSTTETENTLTAVQLRTDSLLAVNDSAWREHNLRVVTVRLNSDEVDFAASDSLGRDLAVEDPDSLALPFEIVYWDRVLGKGRLHVRLPDSLREEGKRLQVRWKLPLEKRSDSGEVWRAVTDSQKLILNSFLADDFERGTLRSRLPDSAAWYRFSSDSTDDSAGRISLSLDTAGPGRAGHALHLVYDSAHFSWLGLALTRGSFVCMRSLDSLVLQVRGSGSAIVVLENLSSGLAAIGKARKTFVLDSSWSRICLRPQDFDTASGGDNVGWAAVREAVTNLSIFGTGGTNLWVDDIRFYGLDRGDF